jgi:hypothetical protein
MRIGTARIVIQVIYVGNFSGIIRHGDFGSG